MTGFYAVGYSLVHSQDPTDRSREAYSFEAPHFRNAVLLTVNYLKGIERIESKASTSMKLDDVVIIKPDGEKRNLMVEGKWNQPLMTGLFMKRP